MKKWIVLGVVSVALISVVAIVASSYNGFIRLENQILAVDKDMQNVHASIFNQIKSQGLSVEKYGNLVIESINAAIGGRYGEGGSKAAFQWIKENNPTIDPNVFNKLNVAIEAGYTKFEATQRTKIDVIRVYRNKLETFPSNIVAGVFGFPKKNLDELERIITTKETKKTFETKEMETIDPFKK